MSENNSNNNTAGGPRTQSKNNRNRNRFRRNNRNKPNSNNQGPKNSSHQTIAQHGQSTSNHRRKRNHRSRRGNGPILSPLERVQKQYLMVLERHLQKRKKYFELFHRADVNQLRKLEEQFHQSGEELLKFRETVSEDLRAAFDQWNNGLKHDYTYATNHNLEPETNKPAFEGDFEDPHYLPSQKDSSFQDDTEESVGTMEDYLKYKGEPIKPITN